MCSRWNTNSSCFGRYFSAGNTSKLDKTHLAKSLVFNAITNWNIISLWKQEMDSCQQDVFGFINWWSPSAYLIIIPKTCNSFEAVLTLSPMKYIFPKWTYRYIRHSPLKVLQNTWTNLTWPNVIHVLSGTKIFHMLGQFFIFTEDNHKGLGYLFCPILESLWNE